MAHLITQASPWLLSLCVWVGLAYAIALYYLGNKKESWSKNLRRALAALRFLLVAILTLLLFKPLLDTRTTEVEKPVVVLALDNSSSIVNCKDSSFYRIDFLAQWSKIADELGSEYEVVPLLFGDAVTDGTQATFNEVTTHFGKLQRELDARLAGKNIRAVVLASDGLYNKGPHPVAPFQQLKVPVFTVALGDTTLLRDALISNVSANKLAYLGNNFPVRVSLEGRKLGGQSTTVSISKNGATLASQQIAFSGNRDFQSIDFTLPANEVGIHAYQIRIAATGSEVDLRNNEETIYVEVIDNRQKILILAHAPHPDLATFASAIKGQQNYQVEVSTVDQFKGSIADYDMIIAHQLPGAGANGKNYLTQAFQLKIPIWFILGSQTDFPSFNQLNTGYSLNGYQGKSTDVQAGINANFGYFSLDSKWNSVSALLPPLSVPFGNLSVAPGIQPLFFQRIGKIQTEMPLLSFGGSPDHHLAVWNGEGVWRWKMALYQLENSHELINQMIVQCVQFIGVKENKEKFRINHKKSFAENEAVQIDAELYNEIFEPILNQNVSLKLLMPDGKTADYAFSPSSTGYHLNMGLLPAGNYKFEAHAYNGSESFDKQGGFAVQSISLERSKSIADFALLEQLSSTTKGKRFAPQQMTELIAELKNRADITSVSHEEQRVRDLIEWKPLLFALLFLLSLEWFLRKWNGSY